MNIRIIAPLLLLALLGAAWWILQPEQGSVLPAESESAAEQPLAEQVAITEETQQLPPSNDGEAEEPADREEIALQHRVVVLGPGGEPQEGVPVVGWGEGREGQFRELIESLKPGDIPGREIRDNAKRTNADGQLEFDAGRGVFAWTAWNGMTGWVHIPSDAEPGSDPHILQLHPFDAVELIVLDAAGEPVSGRLDFNGHIGPVKELDLQPKEMQPGDYGSAWQHTPNQVLTTADGRRYFKLAPPKRARDRMGENPGKLRYRVSFSHNGVNYEPRIFEEGRAEPIVYQLDAAGSLVLRLIDYPQGAQPSIRIAGSETVSLNGTLLVGEATPSWQFEGLKVGCEWDVSVTIRRRAADGSEFREHSNLPAVVVAGPQVSGEQVDSELRFAFPPGFHGRLVDRDGQAVTNPSHLGGMHCQLLFGSGQHHADFTRGNILEDGRFFVTLMPDRRPHMNVANIRGAEFEFRQRKPRDAPEGWAAKRYWASFEATLPSAQSSVDVGDVVIESENPLLLVSVENQLGQALKQAQVSVEYAAHWEGEIRKSDTFQSAARSVYTDAQGQAWFIGRDWRSHSSKLIFGSGADPSFEIHTLRVSAEREGYHTATVEIPISQREVRLELHEAASLEGSLLTPPEGSQVNIYAVPVGADVESPLGRSEIRRVSRAEIWPFTIDGLKQGVVDVAFLFGGGFRSQEVLRISQVRLDQPGVTTDPRLQNIDLRPYIDVTRLRLLGPDGTPLSAEQVHASDFWVRTLTETGGGATTATFDGLQVLLVAAKESPYERILSGNGWKHVRVDTFGDGDHDVRLEAMPSGSIRLLGLDAIPEGVEAQVRIQPDGKGLDGTSFEELSDGELPITWRFPGKHYVTWNLSKRSSGWRDRLSLEFEVSEELVAAGGTIELRIPQELLDKIPQD